MQVILLEKIQKLGDLGAIANVKSGYARNFLIPHGKAKPATEANLAEFEIIKAQLQAAETDTLSAAQTLEASMQDVTCILQAHAGDEGKLFGSINAQDIVKSLAELGFEIEKRNINISEAIRFVGEYEISISLHSDIKVNIKVIVQALEK